MGMLHVSDAFCTHTAMLLYYIFSIVFVLFGDMYMYNSKRLQVTCLGMQLPATMTQGATQALTAYSLPGPY